MEKIKSGHKTIPGFSLPIFTDDEINILHQATLDLLEKTGVKVESEEALEIFHDSGAKINQKENTGIVKIPGHLIEECIKSAPGDITYHGRKHPKKPWERPAFLLIILIRLYSWKGPWDLWINQP